MKFPTLMMAAALATALAGPVLAEEFTGKVTRITDGDSIRVQRDGKDVTVQLNGIDAPEPKQEFGPDATAFLKSRLLDKTVRVVVKGQDSYDRTLGQVFLDKTDMNAEMVKSGMAWAYVRYSKDYADQEKSAREAKSGLWAKPSPKAPWDWRKENGTGRAGSGSDTEKKPKK